MTSCQKIVPGATTYAGKQGFSYFEGISRESMGSRAICMHLLTIPPGGRAKAHKHATHETAIYVLAGTTMMAWGERLVTRGCNPPVAAAMRIRLARTLMRAGSSPTAQPVCLQTVTPSTRMPGHAAPVAAPLPRIVPVGCGVTATILCQVWPASVGSACGKRH